MTQQIKEDLQQLIKSLREQDYLDSFWQSLNEGVDIQPLDGVDASEWRSRRDAYLANEGIDDERWLALNSIGHPACQVARLEHDILENDLPFDEPRKADLQTLLQKLVDDEVLDSFFDALPEGMSIRPLSDVDPEEWEASAIRLMEMLSNDNAYEALKLWVAANAQGHVQCCASRLERDVLMDEPEVELDYAPTP